MRVLDLRKVNIRTLVVPSHPDIERKVILGLIILVLLLGVSYGYFVKQTILNVVIRQETEEEIADLGSYVSGLEVRYIELKNRISLDFAYSLGYRDVQEVKFVSRSEMNKTLTLKSQ